MVLAQQFASFLCFGDWLRFFCVIISGIGALNLIA